MKLKFFLFLISFFILSEICHLKSEISLAQTFDSNTYHIDFGNFNMTSGKKTSSTYKLTDTVGQNAPGQYDNNGYTVKAGFQYIYDQNIPLSFSISNLDLNFGSLTPNIGSTVTNTLTVSTPTAHGYDIMALANHPLETTVSSSSPSVINWTPSDGSPPVWWIDASQLTGLNDGDNVTSWTDETGNGANATNGSFNPPHYKTNIINGLPVVHFVAASNEALRAFPATGSSYDPYSVFIVGRLNGGANGRLFGSVYPTYKNFLVGWWNGRQNVMYGEGFVEGTGEAANTNWKLYSCTGNSSITSFFGNGTLIAENSNGVQQMNGAVALSGYDMSANSEFSNGDLAEILIYTSKLSDTDRQKIEGYLAWKYDLQGNLPIGHPYKSAAPTVSGPPSFIASSTIPDTKCDSGTCSESASSTWTSNSTFGFGFNANGHGTSSFFTNSTYFRQFADNSLGETAKILMSENTPVENHSAVITYKINTSSIQPAGTYQNSINFIAVPKY